MIDINFSPNRIKKAVEFNEGICDYSKDIENINLPEHEDIDYETTKVKKELDKLVSSINNSSQELNAELSSILNNDFDHKFYIYVQLLSGELIEDSFPIEEWLEEKRRLNEFVYVSNFSFLKTTINKCKNQEIKNILIDEYVNIYKGILNSSQSFTSSPYSFIKEINELIKENGLEEDIIYKKLNKHIYTKENGVEYLSSQANYWRIAYLLKDIENNQEKLIPLLLDIKEKDIKDFVSFLSKTDVLYERNYKGIIKCFNQAPLKNFMYMLDNKKIREDFFPQFIECVDNLDKKAITNESKALFDLVIKELRKGNEYLILKEKLNKSSVNSKPNKI